ncbi:MAG: glycosyltransferase family 9 protein [Pseudomonadota bacterium]
MRLVRITEERVEVDDRFFGRNTLVRGRTYLVHDLVYPAIVKNNWGRIVGNGTELRHLSPDTLKKHEKPLKVLFGFHGGLGDAVYVAMLFRLLEQAYNFEIDIACRPEVWSCVLAPMGFKGRRVGFPLDVEIIDQYAYIQTDVSNFIRAENQTRKWERSVMAEVANAYGFCVDQFQGAYAVPGDVMDKMTLPGGNKIRIGLNYEARGAIRRYPEELGNELIAALLGMGLEVYRFGTQKPQGQGLFNDGYHDYSGATSIFEMAALLKQMDLVVTVCSFPAHLSDLLGLRTIVLLSTTRAGLYKYNRNVVCLSSQIECTPCGEVMDTCPQKYDECKAFHHESITPDMIVDSVLEECRRVFETRLKQARQEPAGPMEAFSYR